MPLSALLKACIHEGERRVEMKTGSGMHTVRERVRELLHLDALKGHARTEAAPAVPDAPQWVIVYRTATGFCCVYRDEAIGFHELVDVQLWAEEMDVQPYFIGQ
jgi:hypothetical protein